MASIGEIPLIVIVGQTATGKTALAIELAGKLNGEIICADSRTVYKSMDIGTAKPTKKERALAPHHLLDVVDPDEPFTVVDFKTLTNQAIDQIASRGKIPIMVGGSGLYVDSVLFDYSFSPANTRRDQNNPRHLGKTVQVSKSDLRPNTIVLGLKKDRQELKKIIIKRVEQMVGGGLIDEVQEIERRYGRKIKALQAPGYRAFLQYINGKITLEEAKELFIKNDLSLAKRQLTWFRRNKSIHWVNDKTEAVALTTTFLNK